MPQFDPSCIALFQAGDWTGVLPAQVWAPDPTATYAMIDASLLAEALVGLTAPQQVVVNSYRYTPTAADYASRGFRTWAGASPPPVYFKATGTALQQATNLQAALAKRYM